MATRILIGIEHFYELCKIGKLIKTEHKLVVDRGLGEGRMGRNSLIEFKQFNGI